jgi:hypothetical protein
MFVQVVAVVFLIDTTGQEACPWNGVFGVLYVTNRQGLVEVQRVSGRVNLFY